MMRDVYDWDFSKCEIQFYELLHSRIVDVYELSLSSHARCVVCARKTLASSYQSPHSQINPPFKFKLRAWECVFMYMHMMAAALERVQGVALLEGESVEQAKCEIVKCENKKERKDNLRIH